MWDEFDLIATHFAPLARDSDAALGLRDDAALLTPPTDGDLALTLDTITSGVHYLPDDPPDRIAQKLVRVNLSDLAAMGARPLGYLLSTAFARELDGAWVARFAEGLGRDQETYGIELLGGDTTAMPGPSCLTLIAVGAVPRASALRRSGARVGDWVYVSGTIGDAALGLRACRGELSGDGADLAVLCDRYRLPQPRVALGRALREQGLATAAVDVSDGLVADLGHLATASGVGIVMDAEHVPLSSASRRVLDTGMATLAALFTGGDDYELAFTASPEHDSEVRAAAEAAGVTIARIGAVTDGQDVEMRDRAGQRLSVDGMGWRHH
ncbi:thiamine-phosphate kinase [Limimonas halophila]|uniref:Thiamine-monophosphate kinase n=1 Tax=Limimonas halophila TaxID=1082479 RepID=A0A1G7NVV2_9PROT|nr:thiamine-phosphate kinase [Limimonas halophila]SDF78017.1 thiamine-phosphate kinase [Limimonas halophila]